MMDRRTILDTDVLSALMRRHPQALTRSHKYLSQYPQLSFSIVTRYEVLRGLSAKGSVERSTAFNEFCATCEVLPLTDAIVVRASNIYADLYRRGQLIGDADILIAATALDASRTLATNNRSHFVRVAGLTIDNWLEPPGIK
jgi:tRNA(fMet)-specific endonuclease VapC